MMALIQVISKIYGILLGLFPRDFQNEFKQEMEGVFTASLKQAAKTSSILVVRACFFELFDLPVNLVLEHLSNLRKGNSMKTISFEVGRSRAVLMAALGMMLGWGLIAWGYREYSQIFIELEPWAFDLVDAIVHTFPIILLGLMLGIAAGVGRRAFLQIGLWTAAGGILGSLVNIPVKSLTSDIWIHTRYLPARERDPIDLLCWLAIMCVYGIFWGAGLGFTFDNWKTRLKFVLIGLAANIVGTLTGYSISLMLSNRALLGMNGPYYIQYGILGALAGGILGWFFGKERQPGAGPVMGTSSA